MDDVLNENLTNIYNMDSHDNNVNELYQAINEIDPNKLGRISYDKYIKQLCNIAEDALKDDSTCLIMIVDGIKSCQKPCYKRDVLLEVLNQIVFAPNSIFTHVLCNHPSMSSKNVPWKVLANSIVTLPDLVANSGALKKFPKFQPENFFTIILEQLYDAIRQLHDKRVLVDGNQKCFYVQLIGRISFSGSTQLLWKNFLCRLITEKQAEVKTMISDIVRFPLRFDNPTAAQFELFIEPLYMPIFINLTPSRKSGELIRSIIGNNILSHESLEYLICNKSIFQANYQRESYQQAVILFNIFAYLSHVVTYEFNSNYIGHPSGSSSNKTDDSNLLIRTLLEIARSWSNSTKIMYRSYDQNRYISCAFIIAFRYALEYDKRNLRKKVEVIQSNIMQGFPIYLNRASGDYRYLAICIGETVMQAIHELVDENLPKNQQKTKEPLKLDFDIEFDENTREMKRLFQVKLDEMFVDNNTDGDASDESTAPETMPTQSVCSVEKSADESSGNSCENRNQSTNYPLRRAIVELGCNDDDDLAPYDLSDDDNCDVDDDFMNIPIYLQDCIDGLAENNNPRYMRLCLIKAGELIRELSAHKLDGDGKNINDAVRDTANELAQLLLYLDDQYNIDDFDTLRINALSSLCVAVPDLVAKYLLDVFNGSNKSARHQLDILRVLTESARLLSGHFVKYVSLYFYGIVHSLSHSISPATIVYAAKSQDLDDSYLLSRTFFSLALIIECVGQQPITCKLSTDLLDILAHHRCLSDSGVRKAMASCLRAIRDFTPSVYFKEFLYDKTASLSAVLLSDELNLTSNWLP